MLVWNAMPSITPMMSLILRELALMSSMVLITWPTTTPPWVAAAVALPASWVAWRAVSALCLTVAVISSIDAAVCCRLLACSSVRWLRSALPQGGLVVPAAQGAQTFDINAGPAS